MDDIAIFVEVVRQGSITKAGAILDLPRTTVSRRLKGLEERVGIGLVVRTSRGLRPTEAGEVYFERCLHLLSIAREAEEEARSVRKSDPRHVHYQRIAAAFDSAAVLLRS